MDVSFAHVKDDVVVGCVDEMGNLFIYRITEDSSGSWEMEVFGEGRMVFFE